ncbi:pitrilysin family protein [uncultured Chryseobacterium sp.]|uniref:M16 family metallopeptidase n=1 Tax=uncultured Chryseobacterium sp. TaxID=259322 RepID=UPI0025D2A2CA|nr:pitrilysin family protein [uncultured Chryseobacterium sp.]
MKNLFIYTIAAVLFSTIISAQKIDINKIPELGPTNIIKLSKPKSFRLENGLTVMVVENNKLPRVTINLSLQRPLRNDGNIKGVTEIVAEQLNNGSADLGKDEFNSRIDFLGAKLQFHSGGAVAICLSKYFPEVLTLMGNALINPKFSSENLKISKQKKIDKLFSNEKNASFIVGRVSNAMLYGKNTARGQFVSVESISNIQIEDINNIYKMHFVPNDAYLTIVGDVKFENIKPLIEKLFIGWKKSIATKEHLEPAHNVAKTEISLIDIPSATQSLIAINNLHTLKMNDPRYFPAILCNHILGGENGRLFMNLREKNGYTYGAYSNLIVDKNYSEFLASASVRNEVTDKAIIEFMKELNAIVDIKPEELEDAKIKLKGDFIRSLEKPEKIATFALEEKVEDLPTSFYTNYLKSIDDVTLNDVKNIAKTIIFPNNSRIIIAGKASEISDGLKKLGYSVKKCDAEGNVID